MDSKEITMQGLLEAFNSLIMRARLAGAMHLNNGMTRLAFARDMTDYADQIIDDVETGHLPLEDGLEALQQAYIQLQKQVLQLNSERLDQPVLPNPYNALGPLVTEEVDPLELITLMSPPAVHSKTPPSIYCAMCDASACKRLKSIKYAALPMPRHHPWRTPGSLHRINGPQRLNPKSLAFMWCPKAPRFNSCKPTCSLPKISTY